MTSIADSFAGFLSAAHIEAQSLPPMANSIEVLSISASNLVPAAAKLKKDKGMFLNFITAFEVKTAYELAYFFQNPNNMQCLELRVKVPKDNPSLASLVDLFATANWQEREAYDMIGIHFEGHPNLTRILNPDNWEGHPLRKDYIGPLDALNAPLVR